MVEKKEQGEHSLGRLVESEEQLGEGSPAPRLESSREMPAIP